MAEKKIQIKDLRGNYLYPRTKASIVYNDKGEDLGAVEAGAQVNKLEKILVNGIEQKIVDKRVNIEINEGAEYTIKKSETAEEGYSASYQLMKGNEPVGDIINIPSDMVVKSGSVQEVIEPDQPVAGWVPGQKYIDLILANTDNSHIYILVDDLLTNYTAGEGIVITPDALISVDMPYLKDNLIGKMQEGNYITVENTVAQNLSNLDTILNTCITYEILDGEIEEESLM